MNKDQKTNGPQQEQPEAAAEHRRPSHIAYVVREGSEGKGYFNRIGSAFAHRDGQGFSLDLDAVPVSGRIVMRTPQERIDAMRDGRDAAKGHAKEQGQER